MLSQISSWIFSIAGIICISVIVELILPNGQMNKYIKGILTFIIILVIILPVPKLLKSEINLDQYFNFDNNIEADEDYLYQLNLDKINLLKNNIEEKIQSHGYKNVKVYVNADIFQNKMQYKSVNVDLSRLVITENAEHNDITKIKKDITKIIKSFIEIDEEAILYDQ